MNLRFGFRLDGSFWAWLFESKEMDTSVVRSEFICQEETVLPPFLVTPLDFCPLDFLCFEARMDLNPADEEDFTEPWTIFVFTPESRSEIFVF